MKLIRSFTHQTQMNTTLTNENETEGRAGCLLAQKDTCRISSNFGFKSRKAGPLERKVGAHLNAHAYP